ncbi:hypothetical protein QZH41_018419 [Actinostola sp. cb2023]|nr:hypothetical protein QZH41_018419 [Actinostola sp. cb2023]
MIDRQQENKNATPKKYQIADFWQTLKAKRNEHRTTDEMDDIFIDLNFLTESERELLQDVLARDDAFRRQEKKRLRDVKAKSGAWFFDQVKSKTETRSLFGTSLIRASLKRRKTSSSNEYDDEVSAPPLIGLNRDNHDKLHRPIPVHMSAIRETKPEEKEPANDYGNEERHNDGQERMNEVNHNNYKPYTKAMPVKRDYNSSFSDKDEDSGGDSGRSTPTPAQQDTSLGNVTLNGHQDNYHGNQQSEEEQIFDFLDDIQPPTTNGADQFHSLTDIPSYDEHLDDSDEAYEFKSLDTRGSYDNEYTAEQTHEYHSLPADISETEQNKPQHTSNDVVPPEIITTAVDDIDAHTMNEDNEETLEDIDQAFAAYGSTSDLGSRLSLSDRFDMGSRESIVSYYSDAGEGHYGNIAVTGEVQIGLKYDFRAEKLEVQVHRARDIAPVDTKKNRSDPYVKVYLLPDKTKGGKRKTRTKRHTLNPEFDEILSFKIGFDEMMTRCLWLAVWNNDRFGHNDFLGEIIYPLDSYEQSGFSWECPSDEWYPLKERRREPSLMEYCGELVVALKYVPPESVKAKKGKKKKDKLGELYVAMVEAHNLPAKDSNGFSDPFCKAYLLPDKSRKTKRKTPIIKKNLNPVWGHTIVYENITIEGLLDQVLELTVWDWDRGSSNTFLGGVRLGIGARVEEWDDSEGEEIEAWEMMMGNANEWNRLTLKLRSLSRFKSKPTDSDSEEKTADKEDQLQSEQSEQHEAELKKSIPVEVNNKDKQQTEDSTGIVNMAYSQTNGDEQEQQDMSSIFKTFNNFTSRFKFTADKIEDTNPTDSIDGTSEQSPKTSDETPAISEELSNLPKDANGVMKTPTDDQNHRQSDDKINICSDVPKRTEHSSSLPEVTTIVTAPEPSSPEKKSKGEPEKQPASVRFSNRRSTDNILFFEGATLSPDLDLRRRHSTDIVSVPKPVNEELVLEDLKKRGSPIRRRSTKKSRFKEQNRRESYSPRTERKQINSMTNSPVDMRRKTLAELALESGYKAPPKLDTVDGVPNKNELKDDEKVIKASQSDDKSPSQYRISGEVYLTLEYCTESKTFTVHVHTANNIAAVDQKRQSSDPYVKTYLLPDKRSKRKTKTVRDNLNPQFDETIKYHIRYDELLTRTLSLTVWNDDLFGRNDFLGEIVIPIEEFVESGNSLENSIAKWHTLCEKTEHDNEIHPELILAVKYVTGDKVKRKGKKSLPSKGELQLQVLEAKNLPGKDADGMSDPFCKISLLPDKKGKTKQQTKKIERTLNPVWNHRLSYEDLSTDDLNERVLEITIWDHDMMSRDEFLGGVRLGSGESANEWDDSNEDESQIWHTMLNRTNVWIQVVIPLRPHMQPRKNK